MRLWIIPLAALIGFALGCNKGTEGGTPQTRANVKLSMPTTTIPADIKQGDTRTFDVSLDRGSEFKKDVKLTVSKPDKFDVKLSKDMVKASEDTKFNISVTPAKDAPLGEHTITVTGTPEGGGEATVGEFKVKVVENK